MPKMFGSKPKVLSSILGASIETMEETKMEIKQTRDKKAQGCCEHMPLYSPEEVRELAKGFSVNYLLKHNAYQNKPLNFDTAYLLGVFTLSPYQRPLERVFKIDPALAEKQSIAALCALHNRETYTSVESSEQIAGICAAVFDYDIGLSENGFLEAEIEYAMDNCGMGGDLYRTPNVSTLAALIAAADGVNMCKHGSPGNTDSTGSSDFLGSCGVNLFADKELVKEGLQRFHFGYTDALDTKYKSIHLQTHNSAHVSHMNDIIGPITNPLHPRLMKKRCLGVNHLLEPRIVAEAYHILNQKGITSLEHGFFVRGFVDQERNGGIDEVSIFEGGTSVAELKDGNIKVYDLKANTFGISPRKYSEPPKGKKGKAKFSREILEGKINGMPRDLILANTAILYYLAEGVDFAEGFKRADVVLESGEPLKNLQRYTTFVGRQEK